MSWNEETCAVVDGAMAVIVRHFDEIPSEAIRAFINVLELMGAGE
jgi:hypothetical protein